MRYYIVEHPSQGVFIDRELEPGAEIKWKYHFKWSVLRTDTQVKRWYQPKQAIEIANEVPGAYVLIIEKGRSLTITDLQGNRR